MTRDPLSWDGTQPSWVGRERRRIFGRCVITGLLVMASLIWGLTGA